MKLERRQQIQAIIAGVLVVLWAADRFVFTPLANGWKARSERLAGLRKSVSEGEVLLDREKAIQERWADMRANTFSNAPSAAEGQMLRAFDSWSRSSGVSIGGLRPQWKRGETDDYLTLECRADASGNLSALTRFLYAVERDPLAIKVDSAEITARDNNGEQLTLALQVSGLQLKTPER